MVKKAKVEISKYLMALQSPERFKLLLDGWIKDELLGLDWGPCCSKYLCFKDAVKYCADLGGRLPEVHELHSIVDVTSETPAINSLFKDTQSSYYWTNTPYKPYKAARWVVGFRYGHVGSSYEDGNYYARPVRASQC